MVAEAKDIFEAKSLSVQQVLGQSGTGFYVPAYQRQFAWVEDKVQKLLSDLLMGFKELAAEEESFAFLGTIIFVHDTEYKTISPLVKSAVPSKVLTVIDGQQRLSTLIALTVALHADISARVSKLRLAPKGSEQDATDSWLWLQASEVLGYLEDCFRFEKIRGAGYYPRMIRAFQDQWSDVDPIYDSPVARLAYTYSRHLETVKGKKFKVTDKEDLFERFKFIQRYLERLASRTLRNAEKAVDPLENIDVECVLESTQLQRALVKFEMAPEIVERLQSDASSQQLELTLLLLYANFVLGRVAVTAVQGKNEQYAFEVFESLNTTGEPLTAYETFTPRVVRAEGLAEYGSSNSKIAIDRIDQYLAKHKRDKIPALTGEMLLQFALVESGEKLSTRLTDQRRYLQRQYSSVEEDPTARVLFVNQLRNVAVFQDKAWSAIQGGRSPELEGLVPPTGDKLTVVLAALASMGHTMALAPVIRYFSSQLVADPPDSALVVSAARAALGFSVLWRAATGSTSGIDSQYREAMRGSTDFPGLARTKSDTVPALEDFRRYLVRSLQDKVGDKAEWKKKAVNQPLYKHRSVARLLLLGAYDDSIGDSSSPGQIMRGKPGVSPMLTPTGVASPWTLEHVAPRSPDPSDNWPKEVYELPVTIDTIGNLVLVPHQTNSMLGNKSWPNKAVLYSALGAESTEKAASILAANKSLVLITDAAEIAAQSTYLPQLQALGERGAQGLDWSLDFISHRGERLLELAWQRYHQWITH